MRTLVDPFEVTSTTLPIGVPPVELESGVILVERDPFAGPPPAAPPPAPPESWTKVRCWCSEE